MSEKKTVTKSRTYRALVDITYGPQGKVVAAGSVTDEIPGESVRWLTEQGHIEAVEAVEGGER